MGHSGGGHSVGGVGAGAAAEVLCVGEKPK